MELVDAAIEVSPVDMTYSSGPVNNSASLAADRLEEGPRWREQLFGVVREVMIRAANDPEYRSFALKNGNLAIELALGSELPAGHTYAFVENSSTSRTFVLPDSVPSDLDRVEARLERNLSNSRPFAPPQSCSPFTGYLCNTDGE